MVHGKEDKRELNHFQFIIPAEIESTARFFTQLKWTIKSLYIMALLVLQNT